MDHPQQLTPHPARLAILGIGQELNGDDGIGPAVIRALRPQLASQESILLIEAGPAPENFTGLLRRFAPRSVILVDAAQMNRPPGALCWLEAREATGFSASSHTLPLSVLADYLEGELGCQVEVLAIQVKDTRLGAGLSPEVQAAIAPAVQQLLERAVTIGKVLSDLARQAMVRQVTNATRDGVPLFPVQPGAGVVTPELISQLQDETA
jgi:hydrogenase 3 maturation protease